MTCITRCTFPDIAISPMSNIITIIWVGITPHPRPQIFWVAWVWSPTQSFSGMVLFPPNICPIPCGVFAPRPTITSLPACCEVFHPTIIPTIPYLAVNISHTTLWKDFKAMVWVMVKLQAKSLDWELTLFYTCHKKNKNNKNPSTKSIRMGCTRRLKFDKDYS